MARKKVVAVNEKPGQKGQDVGYVRVSSADQNTARQLDGVHLDRVFTDKASGRDTARPQFQAMLGHVRDGDTLHVHSLDRLGRNMLDLLTTVQELTGRGVRVQFHKENLTFGGEENPMSTLQFQMMSAFAQFERAMIRERQREGIEKAKAAGVYKGREYALKPAQVAELRADVAGGMAKTAAAKKYNIHRASVYRYLESD